MGDSPDIEISNAFKKQHYNYASDNNKKYGKNK